METKHRKAMQKIMNNDLYGTTKGKLRHRIDVRHVINKKGYLKWTLKPSYVSHKIFDNNLFAIHKSKVTLTLIKPAYVGMCMLDLLDLSKVLM